MRKYNKEEMTELFNYAAVRTLYSMMLGSNFPVLYTDIEEREDYRVYHVQLTPDVPTAAFKGLSYKLYAERTE